MRMGCTFGVSISPGHSGLTPFMTRRSERGVLQAGGSQLRWLEVGLVDITQDLAKPFNHVL